MIHKATIIEKAKLQRLIAARALANIDSLPPLDRAAIYEAVSVILPASDRAAREEARAIALHLRAAETAQLNFSALFDRTENPQPSTQSGGSGRHASDRRNT